MFFILYFCKKKKIMKYPLSLFLCLLMALNSFAQKLEVKWTDQFQYDNKKDGFFESYVGTNASYIYAKFNNLRLVPSKRDKKIKLLAFDKNTMKKVGDIELKGYDNTKAIESDYNYYKTVTLDDVVYVFWTKSERDVVELYAQTFDVKLKKISKLKKIYELKKNGRGVSPETLVLLYNNELNNKILLAKEFGISKDNEDLKIEYKLLNSDLTFFAGNQLTLPVQVTKRKRGIFSSGSLSFDYNICSYQLADDGRLYVQNVVTVSDEEKKLLKKNEARSYPNIMQITMETGNLQSYKLKFPNMNTFNFSSLISKNGVRLYGFFSDLDKDEKGRDSHGLFFVNLDNTSFTVKESKLSYFEKSFLDQLYASDKENQKKGRGLFKSSKAKASDEESIDDNYVIESVLEDGEDIVLFSTIMNNWSRQVCTTNPNGGGTSCRTEYYCTKNNVTSFRLNKKGDILWAKNLDRSITYPNWNIYDLSVVKNSGDFYVAYGSNFQINSEKKNRRSSKSKEQKRDRFEYATFSAKTGDYKRQEYRVNAINTKKEERKLIDARSINVFDNKMYTSCVRTKIKPLTFLSCLCPPVFYILYFSGNSRKGTGYLGTINTVK